MPQSLEAALEKPGPRCQTGEANDCNAQFNSLDMASLIKFETLSFISLCALDTVYRTRVCGWAWKTEACLIPIQSAYKFKVVSL